MTTIKQILAMQENQIFDRKSIRVSPSVLSTTICAFANADGGIFAIGITDKQQRIEGVDYYTEQLNEILRTPIDFCSPSVPVRTEFVGCVNSDGKPDHILLMHVDASPLLHTNQADDAYVRVGDKSKKLDFNDRLILMYSKGVRYYEDEPVADATIADLDMNFVAKYCKRINYRKKPEQYVRENKRFVTVKNGCDRVSVAAILLFGKNPQMFFPKASIRFIRYDGNTALVGKNMNVIKDVTFEGRILEQVEKAVSYIKLQMKERMYLGPNGVFITEEEYCNFVRTELVVNAVTHRDYGIKGTDIQIKMFDNRLEIDSPGTFAGMVKKENIRYTHFSRNPKIASFLRDYGYVKEYGEGVDRMCMELERIGLPAPLFDCKSFILRVTVMSSVVSNTVLKGGIVADSAQGLPIEGENIADSAQDVPTKLSKLTFDSILMSMNYNEMTRQNLSEIYKKIELNQIINSSYVAKIMECSERTARNLMNKLKDMGVLVPIAGKGKGMYRFRYKNELNG